MSKLIANDEASRIIEALCERFGFSTEIMGEYKLYMGAKGKVFLIKKLAPEIIDAAIVGMHIATVAKAVKPSTNFVQHYCAHFTKNVLEVQQSQVKELINGLETFPLPEHPDGVSDGYVALSYNGEAIICGFLKNREVQNMLPKSRRRVLEFV